MTFQKPSHTFTKIHLKALRTNIFQILFILSFLVSFNTLSYGQNDLPKSKAAIAPKIENDSILKDLKVISTDSLLKTPLNIKEGDSIVSDSIPKKKEFLTDIVNYKAKDYVAMSQKDQKIRLYNEAEVYYGDMEIKAGIIVIDYSKNLVYAGRIKDSLGNYSQSPVFKQGSNVVEPDSIVFNTKTQKALIFNSKTEQSGGTIIAELTKKENDSTYFIHRGKFTTSENLDDPEFYFLMRKAKVVPGKKIVTGLTNLFIYDVPTPIGLPFAYFPMSDKQTSGVILPSFGENNDRGYFLQNGGYYFAISDYLDLAILGDYYTNGSYATRIESNYAKRYKFKGNFSFRYENLITSERGFDDYAKNTIYNIRWSHTQDAKASPSSSFSASVNLGSSNYYQQSVNQLNASSFLNNTLSSSIAYSKTFDGEPQTNLSVTATHSQNTNTNSIIMSLPTVQASVGRVYPFAPKEGSKSGFIQNINLQYSVRGENSISTTDSLFFKSEMFDDAKIGMKHSIPISTNFKIFKYFSVSASTNFEENWTLNTIKKYYDQDEEAEVTIDRNNFDAYRTYNFSTSLGTTIYGKYDFTGEGKDPKIQAIRHVMRPSISYSINPSFDKYYETYEIIDADGTTSSQVEYSRFEQSLYGAPNQNFSSSMGLSLSNNLEAKVRSKDSTATEGEKITLLNSFNLSTAYNFAGDSLQWSPLRISGGTQLLDSKMSVNFGATLDPYALDNNNTKIDKFNVNNGGSLFRLTSASMNLSYNLSNNTFSGRDEKRDEASSEENLRNGGRSDDLFGRAEDFADTRLTDDTSKEDQKPSKLYNYAIPWTLRIAYAVNYSNSTRQDEISSHSLMFSGDVEIAPRWTIGASSGYDFKNQGFSYTQLRFERDLLSWRMNLSWIPFSSRSSWNFFIGIKSSLLKDLKYDKRKQADQQL